MAEMLDFANSPFLQMNMDTGDTFIAGQDPVPFLNQFMPWVNHVHIKDVSKSLAAVARGELTGIAVSHNALGNGVNATKNHALYREAGGCRLQRIFEHRM